MSAIDAAVAGFHPAHTLHVGVCRGGVVGVEVSLRLEDEVSCVRFLGHP